MHARFVLATPDLEGGTALAVVRLAAALIEAGNRCDIVVTPSTTYEQTAVPVRATAALPLRGELLGDAAGLSSELAAGSPDVLVVSEAQPDVLISAARVAPTLLHSHQHWAVCPDGGRYWYRFERECTVQAGAKCLALRPVLGCAGKREVLSPKPVATQRALLDLLRHGGLGTLAISSHQARLLLDHGVPESRVAIVPNLGLRLSAAELRQAAVETRSDQRSTVAYFGRLSKEKGAKLLPALAAGLPPGALQVFGDGYLRASLQGPLGSALRGHISQRRVAGALQWARAVVFPSLWPEPGGIVGIDAQLFGCPLGAFALGAAVDWPYANLFGPGDVAGMTAWAREQPPVRSPRPEEMIAAAQAEYWRRGASRADRLLRSFVETGRFSSCEPNAVREDLIATRQSPTIGPHPTSP